MLTNIVVLVSFSDRMTGRMFLYWLQSKNNSQHSQIISNNRVLQLFESLVDSCTLKVKHNKPQTINPSLFKLLDLRVPIYITMKIVYTIDCSSYLTFFPIAYRMTVQCLTEISILKSYKHSLIKFYAI